MGGVADMGSVHPYDSAKGRRYRVLYRKPDHSQGQKRGFTTKKEAQLFLSTVEISKSRGDYIDPAAGRIRISDYGASWLESQAHLKPSARRAIESSWRIWVQPRWGKLALAEVQHSDVGHWVSEISKSRSATTTSRAFGVLAGLLDSAVLDRRLHANPARGVRLPKKKTKRKIYLTHEQVETLAKECGPRRSLVYFLAYTGLRWGEATGLRVRDLDVVRRRIAVVDNAVTVGAALIVGSPKPHRVRSVPIPKFLSRLLASELEGKGPEDLLFGDGVTHLRLPHSTAGWLAHAIRRIQKVDASFPRLSPHELRHTAASLAVSAGANVKAVQRMLGHASAAMTLDVYADLFDDDLDSVAKSLDGARRKALAKAA
jgi:integrase